MRQVKQQEIPPHEATRMPVFPWEYCFVLLPEGLLPGDLCQWDHLKSDTAH